MGKKKGKKVDVEKKAALAARKEAKAEKVIQKRLKKENGENVSSEDLNDDKSQFDSLLQQYQAADRASQSTTVQILESFPLPRANATLTLYEDTKKKNAEVYLFGGEYFDGVENIFLNHLLKYDLGKHEWKQIYCPTSPPPRCAHSCVYYNHSLWVFGGELSRDEQFHHYKDLWRYDIKELQWEEIKPSRAVGTHPTARSGHSAIVWKHYMILFGGFYEANKETPRWYNEVYVMNLQTQQWLDIPHSKLSIRPEPRSACNVAVIGDDVVIHGGFSKLSKTALQLQKAGELQVQPETKVHTDAWILHLKPLLSNKPPTWERLTSSTVPQQNGLNSSRNPNGRAATGSVQYKNRLLVFGGVVDREALHHKVDSVFYNDMFAMDVEKRKWFPVIVRPASPTQKSNIKTRRKQDSGLVPTENQSDDDESDDGLDKDENDDENQNQDVRNQTENAWNLEKLRANMFAFVDGDGNIVHERLGQDSSDDEQVSPSQRNEADEEEKEEEKCDDDSSDIHDNTRRLTAGIYGQQHSAAHQSMANSSVMRINPQTKKPEAVARNEPLPRINPCMVVSGNTLLLYGGLLEVGAREITCDDMWSLDLRKHQTWDCLWPGTMHKQVWRGAVDNDEDSNYSESNRTDQADEEDEEDGNDDNDDNEGEESKDEEEKRDGSTRDQVVCKKDCLKSQLTALRDAHDLANSERTPDPGETLTDFYIRTSEYWNSLTGLSREEVSFKEIKREGFALAKVRFDGLVEILERFAALELEYRKEKKEEKNKKKILKEQKR